MPTLDDTKLRNEQLLDWLTTPGLEKRGYDAVDDYTRTKMREDGFWGKIIEMQPITNAQLDREVAHDEPVKIIDKEPDCPPAASIPFLQTPQNWYIHTSKYLVEFCRVTTNRFQADVATLRTYHIDLRQVFADNSIKEALKEIDRSAIAGVTNALVASGALLQTSGIAQWLPIPGGITRESTQDALSIQPKTPFSLEVDTVLQNHITVRAFLKWGRDEIGGDYAQDLLVDGFKKTDYLNVRHIVTIKRDLVPDNAWYMFAHPKFMGKFFELEPMTMYMERKRWMLMWDCYTEIGSTLGHTAGVSRADFIG